MWRVCSGQLYKIMVKKAGSDDATLVPFRPNAAQLKQLRRLWTRNLILKARQLGFTTLIAILWLDHALFNENQRCGIIAQDKEAAEVIFRDKVKLAYDNLPDPLKMAMPLKRDSAQELLFDHNNSSIRVATSMRSGTIHRLHVSEFGKIGAEYPGKAQEVVTGSLPAVPLDGIAIIESTAQGQDGEFYKMTMKALDLMEQGKRLTAREYRLHFYPWFYDEGYCLDEDDARATIITEEEHAYFDSVEALVGAKLSLGQRAWYVATRDSDFSGDPEKMWQEYPSTPREAFQQSTEGHYYSVQLANARKEGRITDVPHVDGYPVNTFWDIGGGDGTGIWLHQRVGLADRFIGYIEGWDKPYSHYINLLQKTGYVWGRHYLPHDADSKRQQGDAVESALDNLSDLGLGGEWVVVPRVDDLQNGIQMTRSAFSTSWFDQTACKDGLIHLAGYKKKWNRSTGSWSDDPVKNIHREAADAYRQFAQSHFDEDSGERKKKRRVPKNWKTR